MPAACSVVVALAASAASGQQTVAPSEWLGMLDRQHRHLVSPEGHAQAKGLVEAIDSGPGIVTLISDEMRSADKTIWMPAMRMVFHVTNRQLLEGIRPGNRVEFEAARLKGAVMIVGLKKVE